MSELHPFRVLPKYRKLMSEGAEANAIVIKADNTLASGTWRLTLRVEFGDGTTTEIERQEGANNVGFAVVGTVLPIRYDPKDRSRIEIDIPKRQAQLAKEQSQRDTNLIATAEAQLHESSDPAPAADHYTGDVAADDALLRKVGKTGIATVVDTFVSPFPPVEPGRHPIGLVLSVSIEGGPAYEARGYYQPPGDKADRVVPGTMLPVSVDPGDPGNVAIDWDAFA